MLEFWFDPRVKVSHKFLFLFCMIAITAILYYLQPLTFTDLLLFAGSGLIFLICRYCSLHFAANQPHALLARLLHWFPIAIISALLLMQFKQGHLLMLGVQGLGIMLISVCVFSPLSLLKQEQPNA